MNIDQKIQYHRDKISQLEKIKEAVEQEKSPHRDRMVIETCGVHYATYTWEIAETNGFVTVQLKDGSILPTRLQDWSLYSQASDYFGVNRNQIVVDDPERGL